MTLDVEAARHALDARVGQPLRMDVTAAADGILRIAATAMSYAVKGVTTERGLDASFFDDDWGWQVHALREDGTVLEVSIHHDPDESVAKIEVVRAAVGEAAEEAAEAAGEAPAEAEAEGGAPAAEETEGGS